MFNCKGFIQDFYFADMFGKAGTTNTYQRIFDERKENAEGFSSFVDTLSCMLSFWSGKGDSEMANLYRELFRKAESWAKSHFKVNTAKPCFC